MRNDEPDEIRRATEIALDAMFATAVRVIGVMPSSATGAVSGGRSIGGGVRNRPTWSKSPGSGDRLCPDTIKARPWFTIRQSETGETSKKAQH